MAKKNQALDGYSFSKDTPVTGIEYGIEYHLDTITKEVIEAMIERGSTLFTAKPAPKVKAKPTEAPEEE